MEMMKSDVMKCQFSSWYNDFKNCTFRSKVIDLPDDVKEYLLADGMVMPEGCDDNLQRTGLEGDSDDEVDWDTDTPEAKSPKFDEFNIEIKSAIESLGGTVFPKLNWSAPKDASWIATERNLKCRCPRDIYMLLKSSDFISHDLTQPLERCSDTESYDTKDIQYQLVLRRWHDIHPAGEFRCFVCKNKLIAISQRQLTAFLPSIPGDKNIIREDILEFYTDKVQGKFGLQNYVFDVYRTEEMIYLVDFNPYGSVTDGQLFTWEELPCDKPLNFDLTEDVDIKPVFRCIEYESEVHAVSYQCYAMPQDFVHLSSGEDANKLIDFLKMKTQNQNDSSTDDDA